jgi:diadenosine tetraphosphate (Ap4A) HIT family hydrolase
VMSVATCVSCATLTGARQPPGGILYDDTHWVVFLRARPLLVPGQGFIVLRRHCEHLGELTTNELAALGHVMHHTQCAYDLVLQPAKVHFGLYAEGVKHLHLHVVPRMPNMPAGNIPMTFLHIWTEFLATVRLKRPFSEAVVQEVAARLRQAFVTVANTYHQTNGPATSVSRAITDRG